MSCYLHTVPGRLRLKMPALKGSPEMARKIQGAVSEIHGVEATAINTLTGSLLVNYDPAEVSSREILDTLGRRGHVDPSRTVTREEQLEQALSRASQLMAKALLTLFVDRALSNSGLAFLAVLI
jgi:cation transport ATPase